MATILILDCFTLPLLRYLTEVLYFIGPPTAPGNCMEIHAKNVQKQSHNGGTLRQPHVYL